LKRFVALLFAAVLAMPAPDQDNSLVVGADGK
jgi:hypothetical protein